MLKKIRKGVFETNSSSTHSITIADSGKLVNHLNVVNGIIEVYGDEFGWEYETHHSAQTKLSYLITYLFENYDLTKYGNIDNYIKAMSENKKAMYNKLCNAVEDFTGATIKVVPLDDYYPFGYIDHQSLEIAEDVLEASVSEIKKFIFNPLSVLTIDNDNH